MQTSSSSTLPTDSPEQAARTSAVPKRPELAAPARPDLVAAAAERLGFLERLNLRLIRASFEPGLWDEALRLCQRTVGQAWLHYSTRNLRHVFGKERLTGLGLFDGSDPGSVLVVSNHRSFFDLYVITAELVRAGLKKRIVFPVRSRFFYDHPLGFLVNLSASFLAMYPPIFRERKRAALNLMALDELAFLLARGGVFAGLHPEGRRNQAADPYSFLPAQPGVGRVIVQSLRPQTGQQPSRVRVVPVFVSGLGNDFWQQLKGNFTRRGERIVVVFGEPLDFADLLEEKPSARSYKAVAARCMEAIFALAEEEKQHRARGLKGPEGGR